ILIKSGSIPRTSSGKVRRQACRTQYLEGKLKILARWREPLVPESKDLVLPFDTSLSQVKAMDKWLTFFISAKLGIEAGAIDLSQPAFTCGLDSLSAIDLTHKLESQLGVHLSITRLFQASSLSALAELLTEQLQGSPTLSPVPAQLPTDVAEFELSRGQHALYYLHQLVPDIPVFNLAILAAINHPLETILLRRAFQKLVDRHPTLRTNFIPTPSGPLQRVRQRLEVCFLEVPAETWT